MLHIPQFSYFTNTPVQAPFIFFFFWLFFFFFFKTNANITGTHIKLLFSTVNMNILHSATQTVQKENTGEIISSES